MAFDFFDDTPEDSTGTPEGESQEPEVLDEESTADDSEIDGDQDDPDREEDEDLEEEDGEDAIELDGEFITLDEIRELKKSEFREQDYTKKTQALSEKDKALNSRMAEVDAALATFADVKDEVKKLLVADFEGIDLKSLRDEDYVEYRRTLEDKESKEKQLDSIIQKAEQASKDANAERSKELGALMGWDDKAKYKQDVETFQSFAEEMGLNNGDMRSLNSPKVMAAMFELAELKKAKKAAPPKGKVKKVNISKRSKSSPPPKAQSKEERRTSTSFFN